MKKETINTILKVVFSLGLGILIFWYVYQGQNLTDLMEKAKEALKGWAAMILDVEGQGDMQRATTYAGKNGKVREQLGKDLNSINAAGIPLDIRFKQGMEALGLK